MTEEGVKDKEEEQEKEDERRKGRGEGGKSVGGEGGILQKGVKSG